MKNFTHPLILLVFLSGTLFAQQEKGIVGKNNWLNPWTEFRPGQVEYGEPTQILSGSITQDTKLNKRDVYLLLGAVFVSDSTTLTIEPGTVIIGDYKSNGSLVIAAGSKIMAEGTETDPIVFTSNRSVKREGDWGGVFILGDAPINKYGNGSSLNYGMKPASFQDIGYGGKNKESNSGVFKYVRIEFAGRRTMEYGYYSGLTLAGVGSKTQVENVMVAHADGNSFNVLGGNIRLNKLVSFRTKSNDFEFNYGTQCHISNSLAIRSPYVSGPGGSRCMYVASYDKRDEVDFSKQMTSVVAENMTMINVSDNLANDMQVGLVKEALYVAENTSLDLNKSVISGFNPAVLIDNRVEINAANLEKIKFRDMYFNNCKGNIFTEHNSNNADLENWYGNRAFFNVYSKGADAETFIDAKNARRPDFRLRINKIIASTEIEN